MNPQTSFQSQSVALIDGFLSAHGCAKVLDELRFAFWWPSTVVNRSLDGGIESFSSETRRSETTTQEWFSEQLSAELAEIQRRLCFTLGLKESRIEPWQATRYGCGGRFDAHDDAGLFANEPGGERTTTLLLYLDTPEAGGETEFPELDLVIAPESGRLVAWQNLLPDGNVNLGMRHRSRPVMRGQKTTLVTWCRQLDIAE